MAVTEKSAKTAVTHYEVIAYYPGYTHLRLRLETGRTHQIRVHMAYLGHPVAGDTVYGRQRDSRSWRANASTPGSLASAIRETGGI